MDAEIKTEFENLSLMVKGGFDAVDKQFVVVDKQFDAVKSDIKDLKTTLTTQYPTKDFLTEKLFELEEKIGKKIEGHFEKEIKFNLKVVELFKKLKAPSEDISELEQLIEASAKQYASK